jgi:hypothetical protein
LETGGLPLTDAPLPRSARNPNIKLQTSKQIQNPIYQIQNIGIYFAVCSLSFEVSLFFPMLGVLLVPPAIFKEFQPLFRIFFVLCRRVIFSFTLGTD